MITVTSKSGLTRVPASGMVSMMVPSGNCAVGSARVWSSIRSPSSMIDWLTDSKLSPTTSGTSTATESPARSTGLSVKTQYRAAPTTTRTRARAPQIQATGGRVWVRGARSSPSAASRRRLAAEACGDVGSTPKSVDAKASAAERPSGTLPEAAMRNSSRNWSADWYRSSRPFSKDRMTTADRAGETAGRTALGGTAISLTCW